MSRVRTQPALGVAVCVAVSGLAAGATDASGPSESEPVAAVELVYTYDGELGQPIRDVLATMDGGPDVTMTIAGETYDDVLTRLASDRTAGTLPDIAMIGLDTARTVADAGLAVPLDALLEADTALDRADFSPAAMTRVTFDDQIYGMPCMGNASPILYFNADIFTAAGLDPSDPPETWSEVIAASEQITSSGTADYGIYYIPNSYLFQSAFFSNGGSMMDADRQDLELDSPEAAEVLAYYQELAEQGLMVAAPQAVGRDSFLQGQTAMLVTSSSGAATIGSNVSFDVRTGLFPIPDDGERVPVLSGNTFMIVTPDPARQQAAWSVLSHMCSPESSAIFGESLGYIPFSLTAQETIRANLPIDNAAYDQADHLTPWFNFPGENAVEITTTIDEMIQAVIAGEDVEGTLTGAADEIEALLP